ncbi:enoyl-CoA hydratase/Enoyl-CoA isomerase/3- hydroxyacyl-CoA dehydrogenase [Novymonas esmeraldas]|uniref:Enoyl-CoA hydratase/Enoyl-CoA isomerase/3-hydroxyacyl-CoA dehydrogenase n=1 Tax=Novymonas esmeraldas TaxID=1808958 RepID=A0AAW0ERS3_9TRYP
MNRVDVLSTHLQDNSYVRVERRGAVGLIRMLRSAPPRSQVGGCVLCAPMRAHLLRALTTLEADDSCLVVVITSTSPRFFSSGIDIADFSECFIADPAAHPPVPSLSQLTAAIAACPKVCVAAIQGLCSSWGLELALAADYRVCEMNAQFRFPEVRFGITPAGGGARRLVCRVGVPHALDMLCHGRRVHAKEAHYIGLVDAPACGAPHLWDALAEFIATRVTAPSPAGGVAAMRTLEDAKAAKALALQRRRSSPAGAQVPLLHRGWYAWMEHKLRDCVPREVQAPYRAIEAVRLAVAHCGRGAAAPAADDDGDGAAAYTAAERALFESCLRLPETEATQHLLRASQRTSMSWERETVWQQRLVPGLSKVDDRSAAVLVAAHPRAVAVPAIAMAAATGDPLAADAAVGPGLQRVVVIGAGTMGTSIALMLLWRAEIEEVALVEVDAHRREVARATIEDDLRHRVAAHRLSSHRCDDMLRRLHVMGSPIAPFPPALADADLVFECAPEAAPIKQNIFAHLDTVCKRTAILATSSSAQDVNELAAVTRRPGQVLGIHFFPPANESPLVEVIRGSATERWVVERVMHLLRQLDKYPIVSVSRHGYVGTRLLLAALYQAYAMLEDGCFPMQIDSALRKHFHFTRGIFALEDIMGLDVMAMARASMTAAVARDHARAPAPPKRVGIEPSIPSAVELSNTWCLPSRPVFDIPNALIAAGALGRKTREGWYNYITPQEATLGYRLRHPIASWLWTGSAPRRTAASGSASDALPHAAHTDSYTGNDTAAAAANAAAAAATAAVNAAAAATRLRYPLVRLGSLHQQHSYSVEYRVIDCSKRRRVTRRPFRDEEIFERIVFAMVNEAAKIMSDGVIANAADIDCISVYAFGFPAWKGGLCHYADRVVGIDKIVHKMQVYQRALGSEEFPAPCTALQTMLERGTTFASMSK